MAVGYEGNGRGGIDRADPRRFNDYQTGILYDERHLELLETDHVWLSKNPRTPGSKDWGSIGSRTVTIAVFRLRNTTADDANVIHMNTHLDVWGADARLQQAKLLVAHAAKWASRYPMAHIFLTGDFNSANGHSPHAALLDGGFGDTWDSCHKDRRGCISHAFASTFHGWLGSAVNTYLGRLVQFVIFTVHGAGVDFPKAVPTSARQAARAAWGIMKQLDLRVLSSNRPESLNRMHVDWILFRSPVASELWHPKAAVVAEIRDDNFSSDHFPLIALFQMGESNNESI